jgi:hypothetical protein
MIYGLVDNFFKFAIWEVLRALRCFLDPLFELPGEHLAITSLGSVVRRKGHDAHLFVLVKRPSKHSLYRLPCISGEFLSLLDDDILHYVPLRTPW